MHVMVLADILVRSKTTKKNLWRKFSCNWGVLGGDRSNIGLGAFQQENKETARKVVK